MLEPNEIEIELSQKSPSSLQSEIHIDIDEASQLPLVPADPNPENNSQQLLVPAPADESSAPPKSHKSDTSTPVVAPSQMPLCTTRKILPHEKKLSEKRRRLMELACSYANDFHTHDWESLLTSTKNKVDPCKLLSAEKL